ncbi:MAG: extracellular solute-binding protein [Treponema sp.]|nr:extracellular solute-binding protein [Treponema sp.]
MNNRTAKQILPVLLPVFFLMGLASCTLGNSNVAVLWTDHPEFAFYAEYFNASQDKYKVEVKYFESPAQKLTEPGAAPDIVAASWLKSASSRSFFRPLDVIFSKDGLDRSSFYEKLLLPGSIEGRQYLLPVNFNIPAILFAQDLNQPPSDPFTIGTDEIKERGKAYNIETKGVYTRLGFSPLLSDEFLFLVSILQGAGFREASPIAWDLQALEQAVSYIKDWITEANTSVQMEDDFSFKYFYDPPDKLVSSGRVLYVYMDSSRFFILPEERRANLDFRWLASKETIPLDEWNVYYGIHKKAKAVKAAEAFTRWFLNAETQKLLLEAGKDKRLNETSFGIAGGFSAMKTVTEQIFPQFYPSLLGHMPPETYLSPLNILPRN